jgi:hypothetical protein
MEDLINEGQPASETTPVASEPLSIRDTLKAAMTEDKPERTRDEAGRFANKTETPVEAKEAPQAATPAPEKPPEALAAQPVAPAHKAPPGWSAEAKASFETLPPHVQAAVAKREQEVDNGFRVLQDYKGLEEFSPLVKQAGTTHAEVMRRAVSWEQALQANPVNAVIHAMRVGGVNPQQLFQALQGNGNQTPPQQQPQQRPVDVQAEVQKALKQRDTESQISAFLADTAKYPHAEAVLDDMTLLFSAKKVNSLDDAYNMAVWMRPDLREQLIRQQAPAPAVDANAQQRAAADQARKASRSITGSSAPGPSANGTQQPSTIRDSLRQAMRASSGSV